MYVQSSMYTVCKVIAVGMITERTIMIKVKADKRSGQVRSKFAKGKTLYLYTYVI